MLIFFSIAIFCATWLVFSFLVFDDIDLASALDFADDGGAGWFGLRNILLFGVGFGAAGAAAMDVDYVARAAGLVGVGVGAVLYLVGVGVGYLLNKQESNSLQNLDAYTGQTGLVVLKIQDRNHIGEVQVGAVRMPAMAAHPIEEREEVIVKGQAGFTLFVEKK